MKRAMRFAGTAIGVALLAILVSHFDWSALSRALSRASPALGLLFAPFLLAVSFDVLAWQRLLRAIDQRASFLDLYVVRMIGEAMTLSFPGGAGVAESIIPGLVHGRSNVPRASVLASSMGKRWTVMRAHAIYVLIGATIGFGYSSSISRALICCDYLPWIVIGSCLLPLLISVTMQATFARGALGRLQKIFERIGIAKGALERTDRDLRTLARIRDPIPTLQLVCAWMCESLETFLVLRALGAAPTFAMVLSLEAGLSVVRSAAFFAPAGLGAQDLGYVRGLEAFGFGDVAGAFVILKRSRELLVALAGWALLAITRHRVPTPSRA